MSTLTDLDWAIAQHIQIWPDLPCTLFPDNVPVRTDGLAEWIRLTITEGYSFTSQTAGLQDVRGSRATHPFILTFDIFTELNKGRDRASIIAQSVSDHWAYQNFGDIKTDAARFSRVGEEKSIYHTAVVVDAERDERLDARIRPAWSLP